MKFPLPSWLPEAWRQSPPRRLMLRVDAGCSPGLSFGHLYRALTFARVLQDHCQTEFIFLCNDDADCVRVLEATGYTYELVPSGVSIAQDVQCTLKTARSKRVDWLYFDLPYTSYPHSIFVDLSLLGIQTFYVDDATFAVPPVKIYSNSSILAATRIVSYPVATTCLLGLDAFIFAEEESRMPPKPFGLRHLPEVCITFGGSDPTGLTHQIVTTLLNHPEIQARYRIVTGPGFQQHHSLTALLDAHPNFFHEHAPEVIHPLLKTAALVICNGGRTLYETCNLGTTVLPIGSIAHEAEAIRGFLDSQRISEGLLDFDAVEFITKLKQLLTTL